MAKRNILIWGDSDSGKSTMAATLMAKIPRGKGQPAAPARWPRVDWYNLDKPGVGSIAEYFGPGTGARLIEPATFGDLASALRESAERARDGEIDGLVLEGLSVYYRDDVGLVVLKNPAAISGGSNAARAVYKDPTMRLEAIFSGVRDVSRKARRPDFVTVLTAHAKEIGEGSEKNPRIQVPDVSRNAWRQFVRLCEDVVELKRGADGPPTIIYSRILKDGSGPPQVLARINDPGARAYFDKIHDTGDEAKIAQMRTIPGLVGLHEHCERQKQAEVAAAAQTTTPAT